MFNVLTTIIILKFILIFIALTAKCRLFSAALVFKAREQKSEVSDASAKYGPDPLYPP